MLANSSVNKLSPPVVRIDGLCKSFGPLRVLDGITMEARQGEVISVLGSSGSGKSTMLRCVNLLEIPDQGTITIDGEEIGMKALSRGKRVPRDRRQIERIRSSLGMVFQSFNLWSHMTVLENVIEAPMRVQGRSKGEVTAEAEQILNRVGIYEKRHAYPSHLSGGQQQRAAIARALAMRPKTMLFDEPASALDPELVGEVLRVIRGLAEEGRTMLLVTHEMDFARDVSSRVVFMHKGMIEEEGPAKEMFKNPKSERFAKFISGH